MANNRKYFLYCFPLNLTKNIKTLSGMKCFQLIWLKCCFSHTFEEVIISKRDRETVNFCRKSYTRGLMDLEEVGIITVDRKIGRSDKITVNTDLLDDQSKSFILNGKLKR